MTIISLSAASLAFTAGCSRGGSESAALDPFLCTKEDVGDGYQQLTDGSFSPGDLADLGPDARAREREFRAAGMKRGKFVLFKQVLPKPPFDPPVNVVCQVIEFDSEGQAQAFLTDLQPEWTRIAALAVSGPAIDEATVTGLERADAHDPPWPVERVGRQFAVNGNSAAGSVNLQVRVATSGRFVWSVTSGGPHVPEQEMFQALALAFTCIDARVHGYTCKL